jgi:Tfp pilus assembly protein PilV
MTPSRNPSTSRPGFSLVEVTLAIGIVGVAVLSLVGILGSTFQQVDDIMQTNRALSGVTRLVAALDSPRSIIYHQSGDTTGLAANSQYIQQGITALDPNPTTQPAPNFDIAYRLLSQAKNTDAAVWLYVYERKVVTATSDFSGTTYALSSNPSIMEVASADGNGKNFTAIGASARNVIGTPMRVRLTISKLLNGQRYQINATTGEPDAPTFIPGSSDLPVAPSDYALAYLPVVAEFFPHDYTNFDVFKTRSDKPILVQNIVISR